MLRAKTPQAFRFLLTAALLLAAPGMAGAQDNNPLCNPPAEIIVTPHSHIFGVPTIWDAAYSRHGEMVQFAAGVPLDDGTVMSWGRTLSPRDYKADKTLLVQLNRRGRALTLKDYPARMGEQPVDMILIDGKTYVASSNIHAGKGNTRKDVRLSWYGADAAYKFEKIIRDDVFDYESHALLPAADGNGFIAVLHAVNRRDNDDQNGVLMRFSREGSLLWRRAYRPGTPNLLAGLAQLPDGDYIATGRIQTEDGRMGGWALKLGQDGTIIWQRTYPRGAFAVLKNGAVSPRRSPDSNNILVAGDAMPANGQPEAAWIMEIDPLGEPLWQRYIRREDFALATFGLMPHPDGRLTVALNAKTADDVEKDIDDRDHIRLFTVSAQGVLLNDEAYIEGIEADGQKLVPGHNGERVVIASVLTDTRPVTPAAQLADAMKSADPTIAAEIKRPPPTADDIDHEGWVFVATPLEKYDDPCAVKKPVKADSYE